MDEQQKESLDRKKMDEILNWLSPLDMNRTHQSISDRAQPGSGEWFLTSVPYLSWSSSDGEIESLWCWGIPGAGKTVLSSIVVNKLRQSRIEDLRKEIGIVVIYLKYNEPEQTVDSLLGSVLKQLIQDSNVLDQAVQDLYEHHRQRNTPPPLESIVVRLQKALETYKEVFLVIDGLDECEEETRWDLIEHVSKFPGVRLMVTSRYLSAIEEELENFVRLEIRAHKMDIELFVEYQIQRNRNLRRMVLRAPRLRQDIKSAVVNTAENMFLLARLHVESLASAASLTIKHVRQKLQELPTTLDASYDNAMQRISDQEEDHRRLAFKTLAWVTHVFRPLSLQELQHALAVEPGDSELDEELLMDAPSITALCAGLVVIDKATYNVNLVHYSTKSYFENKRQKYFTQYHASITLSLATYLTLDALQNITISEIVRNYPLASYAAQCLGDHARNSPEDDIDQVVFLSQTGAVDLHGEGVSIGGLALFLAVERQDGAIVDTLLHAGVNINAKDSKGQTALFRATRRQDAVMMKLLISENIDIDSRDDEGRTAWSANVKPRNKDILDILLTNPSIQTEYDWAPIHWAASYGHVECVQLLIDAGADVNVRSDQGVTPMDLATQANQLVVVEMLKHAGATFTKP
ncbi:uncharacterized protein BDZ99DRAFT_383210, partial [Mytilinidion resinicola]